MGHRKECAEEQSVKREEFTGLGLGLAFGHMGGSISPALSTATVVHTRPGPQPLSPWVKVQVRTSMEKEN